MNNSRLLPSSGQPPTSCARVDCDACDVRALTFCGDLGHDAMSAVASIVSRIEVPAHALLAEEGEQSPYVYNVTAGTAKLYKSLPDGRTQHVSYHADHYGGYVADVTYTGEAHYAETPKYHAPAPAYHAPAPAYHAPAPAYHAPAPAYHAPVPAYHAPAYHAPAYPAPHYG